MDIREELDTSFGAGPEQPPVHEVVAAGRRALRRRRLAVGGAAALVVVVLGGTALHAAGGPADTTGGEVPYAGSPSGAPTPGTEETRPTRREIRRALGLPLATYAGGGGLRIDERATVVRRLRNPFAVPTPGASVGLVLDYRGATYWYALFRRVDGSTGLRSTWSGDATPPFEAWVADQAPLDAGSAEDPTGASDAWPGIPGLDLVRFAGNGEVLEPVDGVTVLEQRAGVSVGASFARAGDRTAAAAVRTADGRRYYVLARGVAGDGAQYIAVRRADGGPTLDAFLDLAREKYADGGGLL